MIDLPVARRASRCSAVCSDQARVLQQCGCPVSGALSSMTSCCCCPRRDLLLPLRLHRQLHLLRLPRSKPRHYGFNRLENGSIVLTENGPTSCSLSASRRSISLLRRPCPKYGPSRPAAAHQVSIPKFIDTWRTTDSQVKISSVLMLAVVSLILRLRKHGDPWVLTSWE